MIKVNHLLIIDETSIALSDDGKTLFLNFNGIASDNDFYQQQIEDIASNISQTLSNCVTTEFFMTQHMLAESIAKNKGTEEHAKYLEHKKNGCDGEDWIQGYSNDDLALAYMNNNPLVPKFQGNVLYVNDNKMPSESIGNEPDYFAYVCEQAIDSVDLPPGLIKQLEALDKDTVVFISQNKLSLIDPVNDPLEYYLYLDNLVRLYGPSAHSGVSIYAKNLALELLNKNPFNLAHPNFNKDPWDMEYGLNESLIPATFELSFDELVHEYEEGSDEFALQMELAKKWILSL